MFAEGRTAKGRASCDPGCRGKRRRWEGHTKVVCWLGWLCSLEWLPRSSFPGFSMAATVASQSVMKTCSYPAASEWECPDLLFCLPIDTESRQGQCRKQAPLHTSRGTVVRNMRIGKVKGVWRDATASPAWQGRHPVHSLLGAVCSSVTSLGSGGILCTDTGWKPELWSDPGSDLWAENRDVWL